MFCLSSTSYTADEDFMILIRALDDLEGKIEEFKQQSKDNYFPHIQFIITGKGPLKDHYLEIFEERSQKWKHINIRTTFVSADDYPLVVASADLGVCLHFSSSGLDLPMKVVDMFSA